VAIEELCEMAKSVEDSKKEGAQAKESPNGQNSTQGSVKE